MSKSGEAGSAGFPLFICGLARAGTSFLHSALVGHPYFRNEKFPDKELRYFQKFLGNRPWGRIEAVSQEKFAGIDALIAPEIVKRIDELLRSIRGGPHGHYLIANPDDIFYSEYIADAVPDAKFLVSLRDPLTNIWSMLNYPLHTWGKRDDSGFFKEADVRACAEHWSKVASHIRKYKLHQRPERFFILEQERLAEGEPDYHLSIERFVGIPGIARLLDARSGLVVHSTFLAERDKKFASAEERTQQFRNVSRIFADEPRYVEIVTSVCRPQILGLQELGFLHRGPSNTLVHAHGPPPQGEPGGRRIRNGLFDTVKVALFRELSRLPEVRLIQIGAGDGTRDDPVAPQLAAFPDWSAALVEPVPHLAEALRRRYAGRDSVAVIEAVCTPDAAEGEADFYSVRKTFAATLNPDDRRSGMSVRSRASLASHGLSTEDIAVGFELMRRPAVTLEFIARQQPEGRVNAIVVDAEGDDIAILRSLDLLTCRPELILFKTTYQDPDSLAHYRVLLSNLGYLFVKLGNDGIAVRRNWLQADMTNDLLLLEPAFK